MYTLDATNSIVTRDIDGIIISPCQDYNEPNHLAYLDWVAQGNEPRIVYHGERRLEMWESIKKERERRKFLGVKVGTNWFHSDPDSRSQQLGLVIAGANLPPTPWKTLSKSGGLYNPVSVTMTPTLAQQIFFATMLHDVAIHQAAEIHRTNMLLVDDPYLYNYHVNWPESFED